MSEARVAAFAAGGRAEGMRGRTGSGTTRLAVALLAVVIAWPVKAPAGDWKPKHEAVGVVELRAMAREAFGVSLSTIGRRFTLSLLSPPEKPAEIAG
jgi:hypothetical protein